MIKNIIQNVVVWGHKLHSHTHSYIHYGFFKTFNFLGYNTLWLDDTDDISLINFKDSLFITEGQVDKNIPILDDCYYIIHNCDYTKYNKLPKKNVLSLQVFTKDVFKHGAKQIQESCCYYLSDCIFIPWATDLLPYEIDVNINKIKNNEMETNNNVYLVGMPVDPWSIVQSFCKNNGLNYIQFGGFSNNNINNDDNMKLIQCSRIAPAVQNEWQLVNGYIPCRIFKNISYGKMGITNNLTVYELFDKKIIYDSDVNNLMKLSLEYENSNNTDKINNLISLMENVKKNHTYLNRIEMIFWHFDNININN